MKFLLLESTCDETAAAIVTDELQVLASVVASQEQIHRPFQGVVPELAARAHLERILPTVETALRQSECQLEDLNAVAVANTPGLAGSLLVGLMAAKTLAWMLDLPLVAVNHVHAHLYACRISAGFDVFPCVGLVVSGGHTSLFDCHSACDMRLLGGTIDDAAGEAFDKVASMLRLPFPGGPALSELARQGDPSAYAFPRSFFNDANRLQFSFSGLKTAVRYAITGAGDQRDPRDVPVPSRQAADLAASFQRAVVECLVQKARQALSRTGRQRLCVGGGVAANWALREALQQAADEDGFDLILPPLGLCTDNAVMGALAVEHFRAGRFDSLDLDVFPGLVR